MGCSCGSKKKWTVTTAKGTTLTASTQTQAEAIAKRTGGTVVAPK